MSHSSTPIHLQYSPEMFPNLELGVEGGNPSKQDKLLDRRRKRWLGVAQIAWGLSIGYLTLIIPYPQQAQLTQNVIIFVFIAIFADIAIHELGHVIAAKISGFHIIAVVVGPFRLERQFQGIRFFYNDSEFIDFGGYAKGVPKYVTKVRQRSLIFTAGGPVATILLIVVLIGFQLWIRNHAFDLEVVLLLNLMLFWALFTLPFSLIPNLTPWTNNDATQFVNAWNSNPLTKRQALLQGLKWASVCGQRPKNYDMAVLHEALQPADGSYEEIWANFLTYIKHLDDKDPEGAATYLDRCLEILYKDAEKQKSGSTCYLEAAYFEAMYGKEPMLARDWMNLEKNANSSETTILAEQAQLRVEAAIHLAEGNNAEATNKAKQSYDLVQEFTDIGNALAEEDMLKVILSKASRF